MSRDEIIAILQNAGVDPSTVAIVGGAFADSDRMSVIRDAFLVGRDLEAIALIRELDPLRQITILPMSSALPIRVGDLAQIVSRSQIGPFRARRIYVSKETGRHFDIEDIKVANRSYFAQAGSIPAEPFVGPTIDASIVPDKDGAIVIRLSEKIDKHLGIDLDLPLARMAMDITLLVRCKDVPRYDDPGVIFEGFLWGIASHGTPTASRTTTPSRRLSRRLPRTYPNNPSDLWFRCYGKTMLHDITLLLAGAAIVCIGQLAQALVERVSGRRAERTRTPRAARTRADDDHSERQAIPLDRRITEARSILTNLGYHPKVAHSAVELALAKMRAGYATEDLTREALKQCPKAHAEVA